LTRKLRIAQVITGLVLGGGGQVMRTIIRNLDRSRFDADVFCVIGGGELLSEIEEYGAHVRIIPAHSGGGHFPYRPARVLELARHLRRGKYDLVHTHLFQADVIGGIASRLAGIPCVVKSLHNMGAWKKPRHLAVDRLLAGGTSRVICCSEWQRESAIRQEGLDPSRVVTIYHGVDPARFKVSVPRHEYLRSLGLDPGKQVVGTIGRPIKEKGHRYLLEAIPEILRIHPELQFVIVGEGPLREELQQTIRTAGLHDKVKLVGARGDIPELLSIMDLFVFPSVSEGLGIAVLEAMAAGVPVVASNIRPLSEMVTDGETGLLFEARNPQALAGAVNRLMSDSTLAGQLRDRASSQVGARFTERHMVGSLERVYEEVYRQVTSKAPASSSSRAISC
jgi:glycosyltransferase involved in cell wall biosynthesis